MDFPRILFEGAKLMLNKKPWVLRRYLPSFLSYGEGLLGGGGDRYTPPSQWWVKKRAYFHVTCSMSKELECSENKGTCLFLSGTLRK